MKRLIIGNWKMNLSASGAAALGRELAAALQPAADREIVVAPPFTALPGVAAALDGSAIALAAQDLFWEDEGAYTGEISAGMLQEIGVRYALVGHSERRQHLGETDLMVGRKALAAQRAHLHPVICVGEQEPARVSGRAAAVVRSQLLRALEHLPATGASPLTIAYEPVWAIGTGRAASTADAAEMHAVIRKELDRIYGRAARAVRILYGGSVSPGNVDELMAAPGVDGVLVGGASLKAAAFTRIAAYRA